MVQPDYMLRRMRIACWISEATETHSENVILLPSRGKNIFSNAPKYHVDSAPSIFLNVVDVQQLTL
jgi:hypothetical protein